MTVEDAPVRSGPPLPGVALGRCAVTPVFGNALTYLSSDSSPGVDPAGNHNWTGVHAFQFGHVLLNNGQPPSEFRTSKQAISTEYLSRIIQTVPITAVIQPRNARNGVSYVKNVEYIMRFIAPVDMSIHSTGGAGVQLYCTTPGQSATSFSWNILNPDGSFKDNNFHGQVAADPGSLGPFFVSLIATLSAGDELILTCDQDGSTVNGIYGTFVSLPS